MSIEDVEMLRCSQNYVFSRFLTLWFACENKSNTAGTGETPVYKKPLKLTFSGFFGEIA